MIGSQYLLPFSGEEVAKKPTERHHSIIPDHIVRVDYQFVGESRGRIRFNREVSAMIVKNGYVFAKVDAFVDVKLLIITLNKVAGECRIISHGDQHNYCINSKDAVEKLHSMSGNDLTKSQGTIDFEYYLDKEFDEERLKVIILPKFLKLR